MASKDTASTLGKKAGNAFRNRRAMLDAAIDGENPNPYAKPKPKPAKPVKPKY